MADRDHVSEEELNAYVDNELPADRRSIVEAWLATHPDEAARVAAWRKQAKLLCQRYGHLEYETPPARFDLDRLARRRYGGLAAIAATIAAFLLGAAAGWTVHGLEIQKPSDLARFTTDALVAYRLYTVEVRHPVEVPGEERPHLVHRVGGQLGPVADDVATRNGRDGVRGDPGIPEFLGRQLQLAANGVEVSHRGRCSRRTAGRAGRSSRPLPLRSGMAQGAVVLPVMPLLAGHATVQAF